MTHGVLAMLMNANQIHANMVAAVKMASISLFAIVCQVTTKKTISILCDYYYVCLKVTVGDNARTTLMSVHRILANMAVSVAISSPPTHANAPPVTPASIVKPILTIAPLIRARMVALALIKLIVINVFVSYPSPG